jgi:membrane protease YdiL (CAAX protease family)
VPFVVALLVVIVALLSRGLQRRLRPMKRQWALTAALALAAFFCVAAAEYRALSAALACAVLAYTLAPTLVVMFSKTRTADLVAILMLWLPLEAGAGASLVPRPAQGVLHAVVYGVAILLALVLFLLYREMPGMRYHVPQRWRDIGNAALGWAVLVAILIPFGLGIGFMQGPHAPRATGGGLLLRIAFIFFGTALPEEILFRSLIQNWLVQRFGESNRTIGVAALVFGAAHLDNGPQPLPNWRYMIVATIAGFVFGKVFQKSTSVIASALTHAGVNTVKYVWF